MGYSISARFPTPKERDQMLAFLETQDWKALEAADPMGPARLVAGEDLAYPPKAPGNLLLGFNAGLMPLSAWAVVAWVATQSSFRHKGERVFYYDDARHVLVPKGEHIGRDHATEADARGFMTLPKPQGLLGRLADTLNVRCDKRAILAWVEDMDRKWPDWQAVHNPPPKPRLR